VEGEHLRRISSLALAICLAAPLAALSGREGAPLLLVSIDGLRPQDVFEADRAGARVPNLRRLLREGSHATVTSIEPALTYPAHTTLVTGVAPVRHGIFQNKPFDPLGRNADGWYWYADDIRATTLWDAAARAGVATASVDWPVTVGANIRYDIAQYWRSREPGLEDGARLTRALSTRGLLDEAERAVGPYPRGYACAIDDDERRADFSEYLLEAKRPRLHLAYFASLDEAQHRSGPGSAPALRVLERIDALVGRLREAATRALGDVVVAVVSDHGFSVTDRELDLNQALYEAGLLQLDDGGHVRGWRAAAWGQGGSASIVLRDAHDLAARGRVRRLLESLARTRPSPIDRVRERDAALFPGGSPGEAFTVFLSLDTRLVDLRQGFVLRKAETAGDHGHDPGRPEMDAVFLVAGPGVPPLRDLGRIDMRDVAPTLAGLLRLRLPEAEGRDRLGGTRVAGIAGS
jgi:Type I phosphodiesterase / nucleotide pyrophosphatase